MKKYLLLLFLLFSIDAFSHEVRPGYLQLKEISPNTFEVYWKIPSRGKSIPKIDVVFPANTEIIKSSGPTFVEGFAKFKYVLKVEGPLAGQSIRIEGLKRTLIDVLLRLEYQNGEQITWMLRPDADNVIVPGKTSTFQVIKLYTILGVEHILFGFDHLLFVLALIVLARGKWKIIKTVTAFTLAHSITLSLASLGWVVFPAAPVEAVIALSIVYLALEIINLEKGAPSLTSKKPWLVAFIFGLLHGFGFAGALSEIGLPAQAIPFALAFFNVGVELGQLAFVLLALGVFFLLKKTPINWSKAQVLLAYGVGGTAAFWMIERVVGFW